MTPSDRLRRFSRQLCMGSGWDMDNTVAEALIPYTSSLDRFCIFNKLPAFNPEDDAHVRTFLLLVAEAME